MNNNLKKVTKWIKQNRKSIMCAGVVGMAYAVMPDVSFAGDYTQSTNVPGFSALYAPIKNTLEFFNGPLATAAVTAGIGTAGVSAYLGSEQQMGKKTASMMTMGGVIVAAPGLATMVTGAVM